MTTGLQDLFRHNTWATQTLLDFCRDLSDEQLEHTITGVYGGIRETFDHMVVAEANYHQHLTGKASAYPWVPGKTSSLDETEARIAELAEFWGTFLALPFDADRQVIIEDDEGQRYDCAAGVILAQVFNHANDHRSQICTILTTLGFDPPAIDGWMYSATSGRATPRVDSTVT